jgi:predicted enzyme related to lactoylglutathione lyase
VLPQPYYGQPMTTPPVIHCAINADDVEASRRFYSALFGWEFQAWGPPGFMRMQTESGQVIALQQRRDLGGIRATGFECTIAVPDVEAIAAALEPHGGRALMRARIPDVGDLMFFADPSGIVAGAMQFDRGEMT